MATSDERLYSKAEVSAIVQKRLAGVRGIPDDVQREMWRNVLDRLDKIEAQLAAMSCMPDHNT